MEPNPNQEKEGSFKTNVLKERGKNRPPSTRAKRRARTMALVKQVTSLLEQLGPHKHEAIQVLVDQLSAMKSIYHNGVKIDEVPDGIIQQKAAIAILEWLEGKPRELQIQVSGSPDDFAEMLERFRQIEARESLQKTVQGKDVTPALPEPAREEI